jgi:tetratricopeptide (TPR) repeat protein
VLRFLARSYISADQGAAGRQIQDDQKIGILLAQLTEDNERCSVCDAIRELLQDELGDIVDILMWPEPLRVRYEYDSATALAALSAAEDWLIQEGCDILIWGQVRPGRILSLQFTVAATPIDDELCFPSPSTFEIPLELIFEFRSAILAKVLVTAAMVDGSRRAHVMQALTNVSEELAETVKALAIGYNNNSGATLLCTYGDVLLRIGEYSVNSDYLFRAICIYRETLNYWTRDRFPIRWAAIQSRLGSALEMFADREGGVHWLREAVIAHQEALKVRTRDQFGLLWATSQNNLGRALCALAKHVGDRELLKQAVQVFGEALGELTRDRIPLQWAIVQNNLAMALCAWGEREIDVRKLDEAIATLREAHECCTRDEFPRIWAMMQHNRGTVLRALGERTTGTAQLHDAVAATGEALDCVSREQYPLMWAQIRHDVGVALVRIVEREGGSSRLNDAIGAFREALTERRLERAPLQWAVTQSSLGDAYATSAKFRESPHDLQKAATAYRAGLDVLETRGPRQLAEAVRRRLDRTETMLLKQRRKEQSGAILRQDAASRSP